MPTDGWGGGNKNFAELQHRHTRGCELMSAQKNRGTSVHTSNNSRSRSPTQRHDPYQTRRRHTSRTNGPGGGADHEHAKGPNIPPGRKTPESAGEPPLCLFGVPRGPSASWSPHPCPPQDPWYLAPSNALLLSQPNHSKQIRPQHTCTHKVPADLRQTQSMQWGRRCHRIKSNRWVCRLKLR